MKTKAYAYLRTSSLANADGDSKDRQLDSIKRYAKNNKYDLIGQYYDCGVSGTTESCDREGFTQMIVDMLANDIKYIFVENASRLARDLMVQEFILNDARKKGIEVIDSSGIVLTDDNENDPSKVLIRQMMGSFFQFEKSNLVNKLKSGRIRKKQLTGRCEGRLPYGSNEDEVSLVNRILELRKKRIRKKSSPSKTKRYSISMIVKILEQEGYTTRKGTPLSQTQVSRILQNN